MHYDLLMPGNCRLSNWLDMQRKLFNSRIGGGKCSSENAITGSIEHSIRLIIQVSLEWMEKNFSSINLESYACSGILKLS